MVTPQRSVRKKSNKVLTAYSKSLAKNYTRLNVQTRAYDQKISKLEKGLMDLTGARRTARFKALSKASDALKKIENKRRLISNMQTAVKHEQQRRAEAGYRIGV